MGWNYSEKTKQLFMDAVHGRPGTHLGEIDDPDGFGEHGSIACGDALRFTFRVKRDATDPTKDIITDARYLTFGCTSAIAASEALCVIIEARQCTPIEALKITNQDIVDFLEGLPDQKVHCSVMGAEALQAAVFNWSQKRGVDLQELGVAFDANDDEEGRIVCQCFSLSEPYIKRKIKELNLKTIPDITNAIKAGGACMSCHHKPGGLQDLLDETWGQRTFVERPDHQLTTPGDTTATESVSPYQLGKRIERTIDEYIRPMLAQDGGGIEIVDIKGAVVYCQLQGACQGCPGAAMTLKLMVEKTLKETVDDRIKVIAI